MVSLGFTRLESLPSQAQVVHSIRKSRAIAEGHIECTGQWAVINVSFGYPLTLLGSLQKGRGPEHPVVGDHDDACLPRASASRPLAGSVSNSIQDGGKVK